MADRFATLLRELRIARGLTQEALADQAGIGRRTLQSLENRTRQPQAATLTALAEALGLDPNERRRFEQAGQPAPRERHPRSGAAVSDGPAAEDQSGRMAHNLGAELTSFVGRGKEIADLRQRLAPATAHLRLVTITGSGGCGKTRLARWVARDLADSYAHGAWFVDLAPLTSPTSIAPTIVTALGLPERPGQPAEAVLVEHLRNRHTLLVIDNCEHLLDPIARLLAALLEACPRLRILATSRERLRAPGEAAVRIPSLATPSLGSDGQVPADSEELESFDAVRLFLDRARAIDAGFQLMPLNARSIARICSRLDGIPLAIELAAARVSALGVEEIARRLDDRFRLLTAGSRAALPRQQTLRASLDWSHALLTTSEQTLLRRLAVFSGGFPIDAVEAIVSSAIPTTAGTLARADAIATLASLVDKSLVHADEQEGESRYRLLETVRQFAEEKLREAGEVGAVCDAHLAWCTDLAAHAATRKYRIGRREAMQRLEQELDNLRGALEWSMADPARVAAGLNLAGALYDFWRRRGHLRDGRRYLRELLTVPAGSDNGHARAIALLSLGHLESMTGNAAVAREHLREAVARLQETGFSIELGRALTQLALANLLIGDVEEAAGLWSDLLKRSREAGDFDSEASACYFLGIVTMVGGDLTEATCLLERSLVIRQDYSDDEANLAYSVFELGHADLLARDHAAATRRMRESLRFWHGFGDPMGVAIALDGLAWVTADRGQIRKATHLAAAASAQRQMVGSTILPGHKELLDATLARTRSDLGEDEWNRAWAEGQALTLEQAVAYALEDPADDLRDN